MAGSHAVLSPSKGEMILSCAAALGATKGMPNPPSEFAAEGTVYHEIAADVLACNDVAWSCVDYVGREMEADGFEFTITEENAAYAQKYVDAIRAIPGQQFYEVSLDTSAVVGVPGQSGTGDAITLDFESSTIHVDDLKFGYRTVYAKGNKQLLQYGAAALMRFALLHDWQFVKVSIHQPRTAHYDTHTYSYLDVAAWMAENRAGFQRAYHLYEHPEEITAADFNPTEKGCEWCPLKKTCAARNNQMLDKFPKQEPKPVIEMSDEMLLEARERIDMYEAWASSVKAEMHHRGVILGRKFPGWKVVQGRKGNRKWGDPVRAELILRDELGDDSAYKPREIISPADADKAFKKAKRPPTAWAELAAVITQSEGALSLERDNTTKPEVKTGVEFPIMEPA